jgi:GTPase SAR1 family protein
MIIGNKSDLDGERAVEHALATTKIGDLGLNYMEVSAKTGNNIKEFFRELASVIAGGGKKAKDEPVKPVASTNAVRSETAASSNTNTMKLSKTN